MFSWIFELLMNHKIDVRGMSGYNIIIKMTLSRISPSLRDGLDNVSI